MTPHPSTRLHTIETCACTETQSAFPIQLKGDLSVAHIETLLDVVDKIAHQQGKVTEDKKVDIEVFTKYVLQGRDVLEAANM